MNSNFLPAQVRASHVPALDIFRGFAALLMVVNHLGYAVLHPSTLEWSIVGGIVFLGSFAPVLFFFAVGFGSGLSSGQTTALAPVSKVALLIIADQMMYWQAGKTVGLDFFSFIAVSVIVVWVIRRCKNYLLIAAALVISLLALRFALAPVFPAIFEQSIVLRWLSGGGLPNVSYPASPWLVYPLLGLVLATGWRRCGGQPPFWAWITFIVVMALTLGVAVAMWTRGMTIFRWGTMSAAYFALSIGVLMGFALAALLLQRLGSLLPNILSLSGVASFAVVPVHYAIIRSDFLPEKSASPAAYLLLCTVIVPMSFLLARLFGDWLSRQAPQPLPKAWLALLVIAVATCAVFSIIVSPSNVTFAQASTSLGQLIIVALFAQRPRNAAAQLKASLKAV